MSGDFVCVLLGGALRSMQRRPPRAETVLQWVTSFGDDELAQPESNEAMIQHLNHENLDIRGLAYRHLSRLLPARKEFAYNQMDEEDAGTKAIEKRKKLNSTGHIPAKPNVSRQ
jgi:hypothetical protein